MNKKIEISVQFFLFSFLIYYALTVGNSWDQYFNMMRGSERLKYLFSFGSYESHFINNENEKFYPGLYDTLVMFITKIFPKKYEDQIWNLTNSLFSLSCIFGLYNLTKLLFNKHVGKIVFIICFLNPIFFGHMAINPKDTIVALAVIWSTYLIIKYLQIQNIKKTSKYVILSGLIIGLGTGVRTPFLINLLPLFIFVFIDILFTKKIINKHFSSKKFFIDIFLVLIISYFLTIFAWPHVHGNIFLEPFRLALEQIKNVFGIPWILFNGTFYETSNLPYYYILVNLFYKSPEYILFSYIIFIIILIFKKDFFDLSFKNFNIKIFLIISVILFPTLYFIILPHPVYDGLRLFLFIIPFFNIIPGLAIYYLFKSLNLNYSKLFLSTIFILFFYFLYFFIILTPYQYVYLNKFVGDFSQSYKKFENDYWAVSANELVSKITYSENIFSKDSRAKIIFCGAPLGMIKNDLDKIKNLNYESANLFNYDSYDYVFMTNRSIGNDKNEKSLQNVKTCFDKFDGEDLFSVKRNGLILSTFRKNIN